MPARRLPRPTRPPPPAPVRHQDGPARRRALGQVLRAFRVAHTDRPSQERVAEWANLHRNYVSSAERGERNIAFLALTQWLAALGVSWAQFGAAVDRALTTPNAGDGQEGGSAAR